MIDWAITKEKFGITDISEAGFRPKVVCRCDRCNKEQIITIRVKSRVVNGQMPWECPKCVSLRDGVRKRLQESTSKSWKDPEFQKIQSEKSKRLWSDNRYRQTISIKNTEYYNRPEVIKELQERYTTKYNLEYYKQLFTNSSREMWKDVDFKAKMIQRFNTEAYKEAISNAARRRWEDPAYRELMAQYRLNMPKISSIQDVLYSILDDFNIEYFREYRDKPGDPETKIGPYSFDCVIPRDNEPWIIIECQGDYWHSIPGAAQRDGAKHTYITNNFTGQYVLKYLWEHEFRAKDKVADLIRQWLGLLPIVPVNVPFSDLRIDKVDTKTSRTLLEKYHYLVGTTRGGISYGLFHDTELIAVCVFSTVIRQNIAARYKLADNEVKELSRFCIHPKYQMKNLGSWFISKCIKKLRRDSPNCRLVISYADATVNHTGTLYKASNFTLDGEVPPDYWYQSEDGWVMHKKSLYNHARSLKMTEAEFADQKGYFKVWGKKKYRYIYKL